jgi:hypothetical protein
MSEMIERVAKALRAAFGDRADEYDDGLTLINGEFDMNEIASAAIEAAAAHLDHIGRHTTAAIVRDPAPAA